MNVEMIYMPLLNEGTTVWAPVKAERLADGSFRVLGPMPNDQDWAFEPGAIVLVHSRVFSDGTEGFAAIRLSGDRAMGTGGWTGIEAAMDRIVIEAAEPFDAETIVNARELLAVAKSCSSVPNGIGEGYWNTIVVWWERLEIEVFDDHLEVYRFHEQRTDIKHYVHKAGEPFSPEVLNELAGLRSR